LQHCSVWTFPQLLAISNKVGGGVLHPGYGHGFLFVD